MATKIDYTGIETNRWEKEIDHDPRTCTLAKLLFDIDFNCFGDSLGWKCGGDGDNGEALMYALDVYFELLDKGRLDR